MNSDLKIYTCETSNRTEQCIGVIELKSKEKLSLTKLLNDGQRFVANGIEVPINNYNKMNKDQLQNLPYFQNYQRGIPSKVSMSSFVFLKLLTVY